MPAIRERRLVVPVGTRRDGRGHGEMERRVLRLIQDLRRAGLSVSTAEAVDSLVASGEVGLADRDTFKQALATTLIKRARDQAVFEELFDLRFPSLAVFAEKLRQALGPEDAGIEALLRQVLKGADELDEMSEVVLGGSPVDVAVASVGLERLLVLLDSGEFSLKAYGQIDWAAIERDFNRLLEMLEAQGLDAEQLARIRQYLEQRLQAFRRMVRQRVERELAPRTPRRPGRTDATLMQRTLTSLAPEEIAQLKALVERLARRIKEALMRRRRLLRTGRLDTSRTVRASLQYGGMPVKIVLRRRRREKPRIVTLCDVSDSVGYASRFMLHLVWSLQECFSGVRSYVFVSQIAEVTDAFRRYAVDQAVEWAMGEAAVDYHGKSDFGRAFSDFIRSELDGLNGRTTVLVLGDARNNYHDPREWALDEVRRRAKGVVWLNPQPEREWGLADSVMPLYTRYCVMVRECRTLAQLAEVVDNLAREGWRAGR